MKKVYRTLLTCLCAAAVLTTGGAMKSHAGANLLNPVRIWGPVTKEASDNFRYLNMDNQSGQSFTGDIRISISDGYTRILDAVSGFPVAFDNIRDGESVYAYIGPAMTMSLPPMANATMILCNIPQGFKVPDYATVESMTWNAEKTEAVLKTTDGTSFTIPSDCPISPYMTRNMVRLDDLMEGRICLIWSDSSNKATKILLFAGSAAVEETPVATGWQQKDGNWYFYKEDGTLHSGWLYDNSKWYYLDPATGIMKTGFLTLDGKTYFLLEDGSMLTEAKVFTPDENGVLH